MALINCRECGKEVSTEANACPNCGAKQSKKSIWPTVLFGLIIAVGIFVASCIYAGYRQSNEAKKAVKDRLNSPPGVAVLITKYNEIAGSYYVCGMASYRTDGSKPTYNTGDDKETRVLFVVVEKGIFPSVFAVTLEGDMLFRTYYHPACDK